MDDTTPPRMDKRLTTLSKYLSYLLRHQPGAIGLTLDREGWADLDTLIRLARAAGQAIDREQVLEVVASNDKKRFSLSDDGQRIRAAQGHTATGVAIDYAEQVPPEHLFHGTASRFMEAIRAQGLRPGRRHHVHLSDQRDTAIAVGTRYGQPVLLRIAAARMHQAGHRFYRADNGVWLTDAVPPAFFEVED